MSKASNPTPAHSIDLEVSGSNLPLLKTILKEIKLTDSISRIRIEIESEERLLEGDLGQSEATETEETESEPETEETESEPETEELDWPETDTRWAKIPTLKQGSDTYHVLDTLVDRDQFLTVEQIRQFTPNRHNVNDSRIPSILTNLRRLGLVEQKPDPDDSTARMLKPTCKGHDAITKAAWIEAHADHPTIDAPDEEIETPESDQIDLRAEAREAEELAEESEDQAEESEDQADDGHLTDQLAPDKPDNTDDQADDQADEDEPEFVTHPEAAETIENVGLPLNKDTNRWYVMAVLSRADEPLGSKNIEDLLTGTDWEVKYKSVSASLSTLYKAGAVKRKSSGSLGYDYALTEMGEEWFQHRVNNTPGYSLRVADKATEDARESAA